MSQSASRPKPRPSAIGTEEEKAWVSFYRRASKDPAIAAEVHRSPNTIKTQAAAIYRKLGAANRSEGGKAFIVLPSTAKDNSLSRIVPTLTPGAHVSTSKNDINYVVTEFGVAQLRGKTARQRAEALIGIAHPDFRGELREQARQMNLL